MILPLIFGTIGLFLLFFTVVLIVGSINYNIKKKYNLYSNDISDGIFLLVILLVFLIPTFIFPYVISYTSYLDIKSFYSATVSQYRNAIEMYEDKAVFKINRTTLTDLRYQGYQKSMSKFVTNLRDKVANYNEVFVKKQILSDNIFIGWYIIGPDKDMKIIEMQNNKE